MEKEAESMFEKKMGSALDQWKEYCMEHPTKTPIDVNCPKCGERMEKNEGYRFKWIECPGCGHAIGKTRQKKKFEPEGDIRFPIQLSFLLNRCVESKHETEDGGMKREVVHEHYDMSFFASRPYALYYYGIEAGKERDVVTIHCPKCAWGMINLFFKEDGVYREFKMKKKLHFLRKKEFDTVKIKEKEMQVCDQCMKGEDPDTYAITWDALHESSEERMRRQQEGFSWDEWNKKAIPIAVGMAIVLVIFLSFYRS